ncbi:MAG: serine hydrolase [Spirochaetaceae bacterium]|nr:serine hydrolase [Spirochaetaceae bacterium]
MSAADGLAGIDALASRGLAEGAFAGAVLRVEREGRLVCEEAWGEAVRGDALGPGSAPERMRTDTLFDLASLSKLFTATAVLRLASLGELDLAAPLPALLERFAEPLRLGPELRDRLARGLARADLASLLAHSSGIHYWYPCYTRRGESFEAVLADLLEAHPPTGGMIYSDLNFMLLGRLVEAAAGLALHAAVEALVLEPLGLGRTTYARPARPFGGDAAAGPGSVAATEYGNRVERGMVAALGLAFDAWRDESTAILGEPDDGNCHYYFGGAAGHAGIFSDARDLCGLGRLYLEGGRVGGRAFLAPGLAEEALRDRGFGRGLGFQLGANYPSGGAGHTGFTGTYLHVNPGSGLVIALLANRLHVPEPRDLNPFRRELSEAVLAAFGR